MEPKMIVKNPDKFGEVLDSLLKSLEQAGGMLPLNQLFQMTMLEFLTSIASSNAIYFHHEEQKKPRKIGEASVSPTHMPPPSGRIQCEGGAR